MDTIQNIRPRLIEPGVRYFYNATLEQCHNFKVKYYNLWYNILMFFSFIFVLSVVLYIKYKNKNNRELQEQKEREQKEYIINKLRFMQDYKKHQNNQLMTDLPMWQNNPEVQFYNRKIYR